MMIRNFLPVGQGAFYLEQFNIHGDRINVVYDCGSFTGMKYIKREIEANLEHNEMIHAIFISHLDNDHINGIQYLLEYCRVKNIFLPLITEKSKKIILLSYLLESEQHSEDDFFYRFVSEPGRLRELEGVRMYYVDEYSSNNDSFRDDSYYENEEQRRINTQSRDGVEQIQQIIFNENKDKEIKNHWLYIPFNFRQQYRIEPLIKELEKEFGERIESIDIHGIFRNNVELAKLRHVFSTVKGDFNSNSMTLFSGIKSEYVRQFLFQRYCYHCFEHPCCYPNVRLSGCLYTGDYNASKNKEWKALHNAYKDYWKYIGCIQIPHHGSKHNYNDNLKNYDAYHVISAGYNNGHGHPHAEVVKDFLYNRLFLHVVTEQMGSIMRLVID
jgi:hypothetical protein